MIRKLKCIMLIDDNPDDNFFHERVIKKSGAAEEVVIRESGKEALHFLRSRGHLPSPDLIFLDINMPGMNGWEFLEEYQKLEAHSKGKMIVVMLTTSDNPDDREKGRTQGILSDFMTKPLTGEMLEALLDKFFP